MSSSSTLRRRYFKSHIGLCSLMLLPLLNGCTKNAENPPKPSPVSALTLEKRIELPSSTGDYDQVGADEGLNTLYIAGEDSSKIEMVDLKANAYRASLDLPTPHYIATVAGQDEIVVTHSGGDGQSVIINTKTNTIVASFKHRPGADPMTYDAKRNRLYVVAGGKNMGAKDTSVIELDPINRKQVGALKLPYGRLQALAVEENGNRLFTNVTPLKMVAVIDKETRSVREMWPVKAPGDNGLLALDEKRGHLFVGVRKPDSLIVLDTKSGATIATLNLPRSCDDLIYDAQSDRLYAIGGEGRIAVYGYNPSGQVVELQSVVTEPGAKTGLLVASAGKLFVAVSPGEANRHGAVLTFKVNK